MADARSNPSHGVGNNSVDSEGINKLSSMQGTQRGLGVELVPGDTAGGGSSSDQPDSHASDSDSGSDSDSVKGENGQSAVGRKRKSDRSHHGGKRRTLFPAIKNSERCGVCHTCLNPHLHKACQTIREKMEKQEPGKTQIQQEPTVTHKLPPKKARTQEYVLSNSLAQPAKAAVPQAEEDVLVSELAAITNNKGGVNEQHVGRLEKLMEKEGRLGAKMALLAVLKQTSDSCLQRFVQGSGLKILEGWLCDARDVNQTEVVLKIMECLGSLPVEFETLKKCPIGQTVGRLRKSTVESVRDSAAKLVEKWKKVVDQSLGKTEVGSRQTRLELKTEGLPIKKQKREEVLKAEKVKEEDSPKISPRPSLESSSTPMLKVIDDDDMLKEISAPRIRTAITQPRKIHKLQRLDSNETDKVDKPAAATKHSEIRTGGLENGISKDTPYLHINLSVHDAAETEKCDSLTVRDQELSKTTCESPLPVASGDNGSGAFGEHDDEQQGAAGKVAEPSAVLVAKESDPVLINEARLQIAAENAKESVATMPTVGELAAESKLSRTANMASTAAAPTTARLGSLNTTVLGGNANRGPGAAGASMLAPLQRASLSTSTSIPQGAAARAAAAAARAPSPDPSLPKKQKRKKVTWAFEGSLIGVRWFRKDDPPQNAKDDVFLTEDEIAEQQSHPAGVPPGFENAARMEHASEREALLHHHVSQPDDEDDKEEVLARLRAMTPTAPWSIPILVAPDSNWGVAFGEDSREREVQLLREQRVPSAAYRGLQDSPDEPNVLEPEPDPSQIPSIPLNVPPTTQHNTPLVEVLAPGNILGPGLAFATGPGLGMPTVVAAPLNQSGQHIQTIIAQLPQLPLAGISQVLTPGPHGELQVAQFIDPSRLRVAGDFSGRGMEPSPRGLGRSGIETGFSRPNPTGARGYEGSRRMPDPPPPPPRRESAWPPSDSKGPSSRVCVFFNSPQGCRNGESCRFVHIPAGNGFDVDAAIQGISRNRRRPDEIERDRDLDRDRVRRNYGRRH